MTGIEFRAVVSRVFPGADWNRTLLTRELDDADLTAWYVRVMPKRGPGVVVFWDTHGWGVGDDSNDTYPSLSAAEAQYKGRLAAAIRDKRATQSALKRMTKTKT